MLLHDPQTAGLMPAPSAQGVAVIWRCHVGVDDPERPARGLGLPRARTSSAPTPTSSRAAFVWEGLAERRSRSSPPRSTSSRRRTRSSHGAAPILRAAGLADGPGAARRVPARGRQPGTRRPRGGRRRADAPLRPDDRLVAQVSRWDRAQGPVGVLAGLRRARRAPRRAHLRARRARRRGGRRRSGGRGRARGAQAAWRELPARACAERVHLAALPMDDAEENAAMVNALQRRADRRRAEEPGRGLRADRHRGDVEGAAGGRQRASAASRTRSPTASTALLSTRPTSRVRRRRLPPARRPTRGRADRCSRAERVRDLFLEPRHLRQYVELLGLSAFSGAESDLRALPRRPVPPRRARSARGTASSSRSRSRPVEEADRGGVAAVLAADAELEGRARGAAALDRRSAPARRRPRASIVSNGERSTIRLDVARARPGPRCRRARSPAPVCVRSLVPKEKNSACAGDLAGPQAGARQLDHRADREVALASKPSSAATASIRSRTSRARARTPPAAP